MRFLGRLLGVISRDAKDAWGNPRIVFIWAWHVAVLYLLWRVGT